MKLAFRIPRPRLRMTGGARILLCLLAGILMIGAGSCDKSSSTTAKSGKKMIVVIPKSEADAFWKTVQNGANRASAETGWPIRWKGPVDSNNHSEQKGLVEQFTNDDVAGICFAPSSADALVDPARAAMKKGVPIIIFDSALGKEAVVGKDYLSLVATDNKQAGRLAGTEMARVLGGKGKVVVLRMDRAHASTTDREDGFLEAIKKSPDIQVISSDREIGSTQSEAKKNTENMLDTIKQADGLFCPNETTTLAVLGVLQEQKLAGKIKFIGFDNHTEFRAALRNGNMAAIVLQDPERMGYLTVKTMIAHLNKEKVDPLVDTGSTLVTKENLDTPDIKKLTGE